MKGTKLTIDGNRRARQLALIASLVVVVILSLFAMQRSPLWGLAPGRTGAVEATIALPVHTGNELTTRIAVVGAVRTGAADGWATTAIGEAGAINQVTPGATHSTATSRRRNPDGPDNIGVLVTGIGVVVWLSSYAFSWLGPPPVTTRHYRLVLAATGVGWMTTLTGIGTIAAATLR